ncbi:homocysteine-responsive endoplasmic reticulum-resident ubiquitin-like domain member 2 protein [Lucilia sericata]|uniref:homocysteine-responsive endoplasmic reticulum-resident ubiquitin-like domain member 2 protein n=1 Tax=Lucilia sericata TaxID=13632 RepID=UPI0018A879F2|nr:homocysteine-responsive endoplasmic reticulum-resident ubiquitin-like domain member 2 protein [Lucilia sericata]
MVSMDETNTANSSSAAAVADGASAAAHTKTVGAAAPPTIKSASHVKLLIKSSNQQYEDHVIESDLLWTVKRLKAHLSVVYPSKPPAADQKLIYSGQLLNDNLLLKDVIRSYKDVYTQNHIIHLVYTPKNLPPTPASTANKTKTSSTLNSTMANSAGVATNNNMSTTDGLRQRHTAGNSSNTQQQQSNSAHIQQQQLPLFHQQMHPYFMSPQLMSAAGMSCPQFPPHLAAGFAGPYNVQAMLTQQTAMYNWMQQVYSQYMEQCLRLSNTVAGSSGSTNTSYPSAFPTIPPNFQNLFQQQFPSTVMSPVVSETTASAPAAAAAAGNVAADAAPADRQDQQQQALAQVAAARFPNLPQEEQDNRDWLDNFFSITRLALFLTLLYFNSSPLRCLVVVIIAGGIYLYHIGVFRLRNERNNNNLNRNNNAAQNAAVDQIRQGVDQQQNAAAAPEAQENNENNAEGEQQQQQADTTTDTPENANNESMMSTIRTFVVTFFTSLLPETPAL